MKLNRESPDPSEQELQQLEACRAYARMVNTLDPSHLGPWLADDLVYNSQWVFDEMRGKQTYLHYITSKFQAIRESGSQVRAEIAYTGLLGIGSCVIVGQTENQAGVLVLKMEDGKIASMCMCCVPAPEECTPTGEFPGLVNSSQ